MFLLRDAEVFPGQLEDIIHYASPWSTPDTLFCLLCLVNLLTEESRRHTYQVPDPSKQGAFKVVEWGCYFEPSGELTKSGKDSGVLCQRKANQPVGKTNFTCLFSCFVQSFISQNSRSFGWRCVPVCKRKSIKRKALLHTKAGHQQ